MPPSFSKQTSQRQDEPSGNGAVEEEKRAELVVEVAEDQPAKPESKEGESIMAEGVRESTVSAEPQEQAEQLQGKSPPDDGLFSTPNRESSEPDEPQEAEMASLFKYEEAEEDSSRGLVASLPEVSIEELLEQARELRTMLRRHGSEE